MTRRMVGLTKQQQAARLSGAERIDLTYGQRATLRRQGLICVSGEWYTSPLGTFALAPGHPVAPWGTGHRKRITIDAEPSRGDKAA